MLGFSLPKLIVLLLVIGAVWYAYRWISQRNRVRARDDDERVTKDKSARTPEAEAMIDCPVCQQYVPASQVSHCEEARCPYR